MKKLSKASWLSILGILVVYITVDTRFLSVTSKNEEKRPQDITQISSTSVQEKSVSNSPAEITKVDNKKKFTIYMVLWSGPTLIESGIKSYLEENKVDVDYIVRDCKADLKQCHALVKEIKEVKPDLIYTWGTPAALAVGGPIDAPNKEEEYVWDIPIVSTVMTNPVFSKLIYGFEKTGRNVTGVNHLPPPEAQVNTMLSYLPFTKIGVFFIPIAAEGFVKSSVDNLKKACKEKNIEVIDFPYPYVVNNRVDPSKLDETFQKIKKSGIDIVYFPSSNYLAVDSKVICDAATKNNLLTFVVFELMINNGNPLMGLISNYVNIGRFAAEKMVSILVNKVNPNNIPYETFQKFSFFIDVKTMKALQQYPPVSIVDQTQFIEKK